MLGKKNGGFSIAACAGNRKFIQPARLHPPPSRGRPQALGQNAAIAGSLPNLNGLKTINDIRMAGKNCAQPGRKPERPVLKIPSTRAGHDAGSFPSGGATVEWLGWACCTPALGAVTSAGPFAHDESSSDFADTKRSLYRKRLRHNGRFLASLRNR